ncbi:MAG: ROK family glucokinase [Lachnospiraceae bacterium]|nr:ROK family glucokinase [Lachnospiraceae bacterium]
MMEKYVFGIDIGGTTVKCGLFTVKGELLEKWEIPTRTENNGAAILPDVADTVLKKIQEKGLAKEEIAGIGIGVPGPVNEQGEVPGAVNLHWGYVNLAGDMEKMTGLRVKAGNDANVAALGEMWKGGGAGCQSIVMVTLGTGVGGGIINNGKIVTGAHGAGGEIGHIHVTDDVECNCNCGNHGCLEQVTSATGITYLANRRLKKDDRPSMLRGGEVNAKTVFDAVKAGDELAKEVAEEFGKYLGTALASVACVVDPEVFVIGGGVSKAGQIILDYIKKYYAQYAFMTCKQAGFALAKLGNDAGIYGAAKMLL